MPKRLRVLISAYACEPGKGSEPEVGWQWALQMARFHDVTVVTRSNNRTGIESGLRNLPPETPIPTFLYHDEGPALLALKRRFRAHRAYYILWQRRVRALIAKAHRETPFDLLHHLTFAAFRYPTAVWGHGVPAIWGPVGGLESVSRHLIPRKNLAGTVFELARNASNSLETALFSNLTRRARDSAAILVTTRETQAAFAAHGIEAALFPTIGIDRALISNHPLTPPHGPLKFLFVGGLIPLKGIDLIIEALALSGTDATLHLFGGGASRRDLEELAKRLGVQDRIRFEGQQPRETVLAAYSRHHAFLFAGLHDSGGFAVIEAMAQGLPAICLDCGGPSISVREGAGVRIPTGPRQQVIEGFAQAIRNYNENREAIAAHGRAARETVASHYEWNQQGDRMNAVYQSVAAESETKRSLSHA